MTAALLSSLLSLSFVARFIERHAVSIPQGEMTPGFRLVQWGWFGDGGPNLVPFFCVKLPSWDCVLDGRGDRWVVVRKVLHWDACRGWKIFFEFHREGSQ